MTIPNPQGRNGLPHIEIFRRALARLVKEEVDYVLTTVSERSICARLALYLEAEAKNSGFKGYYADVENNRKQNGEVKTIRNGIEEIIDVTCDLILHSRGKISGRDNLIAIEMKKADRPLKCKNKDRMRLRALTMPIHRNGTPPEIWSYGGVAFPEHVCGYELGVFIVLNFREKRFELEYYFHGDDVRRNETIYLNSQ